MAYLPKSKYNVLNTPGNKLVVKSTKQPYIGDYIEFSNGKYYAGTNPLNANIELVELETNFNNFGSSKNTRIYHILNKKIHNSLKPKEDIPPSRQAPTEHDYQRGYFTRFFLKRVNQQMSYIEINSETHNELASQTNKYDYNLYQPGSVIWALTGNVRKINNNILRKLESRFPIISQFFAVKNLWERPQSGLVTQGGELYYEDGKEYTGPYHITPEMGPMVGAVHVETAHERLFYASNLQNPNEYLGSFFSAPTIQDIRNQPRLEKEETRRSTQDSFEAPEVKGSPTNPITPDPNAPSGQDYGYGTNTPSGADYGYGGG